MQIQTLFILLLCLLCSLKLKSQVIDSLPLNWPTVESLILSDNGKILCYEYSSVKGNSLVVRTTSGNKRKEFQNAWGAKFCSNDKYLVFSKAHDSIGILNCTNFTVTHYSNTKYFYGNNASPHIVYERDSSGPSLVIENLTTNKRKFLPAYSSNIMSESFHLLVSGDSGITIVNCNDYAKPQKIHSAIKNFKKSAFGPEFRYLALSTASTSDPFNHFIYYKRENSDSLREIFNSSTYFDSSSKFEIDDLQFSATGKNLYVRYSIESVPTCTRSKEGVKIWSSSDKHLLSEVEKSTEQPNRTQYLAVIDLENNLFIAVTDSTYNGSVYFPSQGSDSYCILRTKNNWSEESWDKTVRSTYYIISLTNGSKYNLVEDSLISNIQFSPSGQFVLYFNRDDFQYYSFDLSTFKKYKLENNFNRLLYNNEDDINGFITNYGIGCWSDDEERVYIYDKYDIWQFDIRNRVKPTNITLGYGLKNNTILRIINDGASKKISSVASLDSNLLLSAFSLTTKNDGFATLPKDLTGKVTLLSSGPNINFFPITTEEVMRGNMTKAKEKNVFAFKSMSYDKYPNYVLTNDFKKFKNITELVPHKRYNWYKTELHTYKIGDRTGEGVLYKPTDFDSTKRYPVIFCVYEKPSNYLNRFIFPSLSNGKLNIPFFVNRGYIVFEPNIYYSIGMPGKDALNSTMSAFNYLSKFNWIDTSRCGLQGISWGAFEINYILTQTKVFKAASVSAGVSNLISSYNSLRSGQGVSSQFHSESGQGRMGSFLWKDIYSYINNSPILFADKVSTPILIEHNKNDEAVPYSQGLEWFIALRRLKKSAWFVEYENEGHGLSNIDHQRDFTSRLLQFFDHYLKGNAAPDWMTCSLPL